MRISERGNGRTRRAGGTPTKADAISQRHDISLKHVLDILRDLSLFGAERQLARERLDDGAVIEVLVDTPLDVAEARGSTGLDAKARRGDLSKLHGHRFAL